MQPPHDFERLPPLGGVMQVAYVVADIETAMARFTRELNIGPWFVTGPFTPPEGHYRGVPTQVRLTLALGFCGGMSFELIQQHDELPSVYREVVARRGHGFHHWAVASERFDDDVADHLARGASLAFTDRTPRGYRVAYVDHGDALPGMLEIIERTPAMEARYAAAWQAAQRWDGRDPVRRA